MKAWVIVVLAIAVGVVGAWIGYWAGHAMGWTTNAEWPLRIGGGDRAIMLSILVSFASVMAVAWWLVGRPLQRNRRLLAKGTPGRATIRRVWRTGFTANSAEGHRTGLGFELEVHPDGRPAYTVHAAGLIPDADARAFVPGAEVRVRYDPAKPTDVAVESPVASPAG